MIERAWNRFWGDVKRGDNLELYALILLAFGLVVANLFGITSPELATSLTLVVLGILAFSMLKNRHKLEEILGVLEDSGEEFLRPRTEIVSLEEGGEGAAEIVVVGISLLVLYRRRPFFEEKLEQGCRLRFLLLDPESEAIKIFNSMTEQKGVLRDIANAFDSLEALTHIAPDKIEARLSNVFLPYGIVAFDPEHRGGVMTVEPLAYKTGLDQRPHFVLKKEDNVHWFRFFQDQYEKLWEDSKEWAPGMQVTSTH